MSDNGNFQITGLQEVIAEIQNTANESTKRKDIAAILRRNAAPARTAIRNEAPVASQELKGRNGKRFPVGNLRKSIGIKTIKNAKQVGHVAIAVGPRKGNKQKYDGFYGFFYVYGTANRAADDFIGRGFNKVRQSVETLSTDSLAKHITKKFNK